MEMESDRYCSRNDLPKRCSVNPFFIRNNPHPSRVRHIKGLLDFPICTVMDSDYRENGQNMKDEVLLNTYKNNTRFLRKRERFVPGIGMVTIRPTWIEQLQQIAKKVDLNGFPLVKPPPIGLDPTYFIKPPNKNTSRPASQSSSIGPTQRLFDKRHMEDAFVRKSCAREPLVKFEDAFVSKPCSRDINRLSNGVPADLKDNESNVAHLLSEILRTDSLEALRHWLLEAPEKEREIVLELIRSVSDTNKEFREVMNKLIRQEGEDGRMDSPNSEVQGLGLQFVESPRDLRDKEDVDLLEVIKENLEADMVTSRLSSRSQKRAMDTSRFPQISKEVAEIEVLRSRLASRSSVDVFQGIPRRSKSCSSSR